MSVAKVIEISASSPDSFSDAVDKGVRRAASTVENVKSAWVKEQKVDVENGAVTAYRVDLKVTFILSG